MRNEPSLSFALCAAGAICTAGPSARTAFAQDTYGPTVGYEGEEDVPLPLVEEVPCEEREPREHGVIVVCRTLEDQTRYTSVIPHEVDPQIRVLPGFEPPPCENNLLSFCGRFGSNSPPPPPAPDLAALPEPLSPEEAERVSAVD